MVIATSKKFEILKLLKSIQILSKLLLSIRGYSLKMKIVSEKLVSKTYSALIFERLTF